MATDQSGTDVPRSDPGRPAAEGAVAPDEVLPARTGRPALVGSDGRGPDAESTDPGNARVREESIEEPGKVMRIGSMVKQLLEEVRHAPLDEAGRVRLREIYEQSVRELSTGLSPDLVEELDRMAMPFDEPAPSESELRIAQAQLVGWLEGLFHGIQATLMAQQMAARAQLEEMRQRGLPQGPDAPVARPGTYL
ncbi:MAG TPA: bacterial proteasome activator family protein [Acidimicrobiales bacterium]|nr:bacterial proteasome activator family protein [Acidimicrobiales bacterium]